MQTRLPLLSRPFESLQVNLFLQLTFILFFVWRRKRDSNPRCDFSHTAFPGLHLKPLGHLCIFRFKKFVIKFCLRPLNIYMSGLRSMGSPKTLAIFGDKRKTSYKAKFSNLFGNKPPNAVFLSHSDISA